MALLKGAREIQLALAGAFFLLPMLLLLYARWPTIAAGNQGPSSPQQFESWYESNSLWLLLIQLIAAYGRITLLTILLDRRRPTVGDALVMVLPTLGWFYLLTIVVSLVESGGLFLFVIPGLYLMGRLFVAEAAFVAEGLRNPIRAVVRSFELTRGNGWRLFAVIAIIAIGAAIFMLATGSVLGVAAALFGGAGLDRFVAGLTVAAVLSGVWLVLLLYSVAAYRQFGLTDDRNMWSGVAR